jgi:hypothetical protein
MSNDFLGVMEEEFEIFESSRQAPQEKDLTIGDDSVRSMILVISRVLEQNRTNKHGDRKFAFSDIGVRIENTPSNDKYFIVSYDGKDVNTGYGSFATACFVMGIVLGRKGEGYV